MSGFHLVEAGGEHDGRVAVDFITQVQVTLLLQQKLNQKLCGQK